MSGYAKPAASANALRLHLNENTAGCSPRVVERLRSLTRQEAAFYPDYEAAIAAVAAFFDVPPDWVLLTNGLDEGILAATAAAFRQRDGAIPEGVGVVPAFDMYEVAVDALGGKMVSVPLDPGFALPVRALATAITPTTRILYVTNPHNPTGASWTSEDILALAKQVAPVLVFVDEAYADFTGATLVDRATLPSHPNVVVGRTFAKAFGLAGFRAGALIAPPATLAPMRKIVPPYSLNAAAAAAVPVALADREYWTWYIEQAATSRRLLTGACARLGLRVFPSVANFMLVHVGERAPRLVQALAERGLSVRDRSSEPGCAGCIRMTTGIVEDTERLIAGLEDAWRDVQR